MRILIVDDSEAESELVVRELRKKLGKLQHLRVENTAEFRAALARQSWDIVLADWSMPALGALGALEILREEKLNIPVIIVSGAVGEEIIIEGMRAGARDYVSKDRLTRLAPAVEREVRDARTFAEQEELMELHELRFRALVEQSADAITLSSSDGAFIYLTPSVKSILGYEPQELLGKKGLLLIHPDDRETVVERRRRLATAPGTRFTAEVRVLHKDGSTRWVEFTTTNLLSDPTVGAVVSNFRDITERKRAVEEARAAQARFSRLFDSGIVGIKIADLSGRVQEANDAFLELTGYSRDELREGKVRTDPGTREEELDRLTRVREDGVWRPMEMEYVRKDGTRVPVLTAAAMLDEQQFIAIVADLRERRRAELALRKVEEQLRQAQKMEAIGILAGGVAHDFNNLLSAILGYSALIVDDLPEGDPMRADVEEIRKAGERASELTRQLLAFSRRQLLQPRIVELPAIVAGVEKMLRRVIGEDIDLTILFDQRSERVMVDPGQVEQVIMNLVVNARDAMPNGGKLTIEVGNVYLDAAYAAEHSGVTPGPYVMLAVSDTGVGMDATTQARIFEPFFTTKEKDRGTGLGLSTVFGIVQQSGGHIWVYSELGKGATFKIYFPVADPANTSLLAQARTRESVAIHGAETILLVEDDERVRTMTKTILTRYGYHVLEAPSGGDALLICEQHPATIHLMLTDVVMPRMNGRQVADRVRPLRPAMKVIYMSGYTDNSVVHHGVLDSNIEFVQKPVTPQALLRKIRNVLTS